MSTPLNPSLLPTASHATILVFQISFKERDGHLRLICATSVLAEAALMLVALGRPNSCVFMHLIADEPPTALYPETAVDVLEGLSGNNTISVHEESGRLIGQLRTVSFYLPTFGRA